MKLNMAKIQRYVKASLLVLGGVSTIVLFQNCNSFEASDSASSSPGTTGGGGPPPPPPVNCPRTSNAVPSITNLSATSVNFALGMGRDAGTDSTKNITLSFTSGDGYSGVTSLNCQVRNNAGLNINCNDPNTPTANGSTTISIAGGDGAECMSGTVTVEVTVTDAILNSLNAPITACNSLQQNSASRSFTVNVQNACLATQRVNPTTPYNAGQMGSAVAIDGDWAVTSAPGDEEDGTDAGAAYVMRRSGTSWAVAQKLIPSTLNAGSFLSSVAISGNTLAVGAPLANASVGAAWVYQFNGTSWVQVAALTPPANGGGRFGSSVAVTNGAVAVGAPLANLVNATRSGAVYVFSGASFSSLTTLTPSGGTLVQGEFGTSLSYSGNTLAVGAPFPNSSTTRGEAVYVFANNTLSQKISNTANVVHRFGYSVALDGNNLLIGAPYHTARRGIAYLYQAANGAFPATATRSYVLADPNNDDVDSFGHSVALKGGRVLVSAPDKAESAPKFGAVYLFGLNASTQLFKIRSRLADRAGDSFGHSIGVNASGYLISGALNDEHVAGTDNSGSVYFVMLP